MQRIQVDRKTARTLLNYSEFQVKDMVFISKLPPYGNIRRMKLRTGAMLTRYQDGKHCPIEYVVEGEDLEVLRLFYVFMNKGQLKDAKKFDNTVDTLKVLKTFFGGGI